MIKQLKTLIKRTNSFLGWQQSGWLVLLCYLSANAVFGRIFTKLSFFNVYISEWAWLTSSFLLLAGLYRSTPNFRTYLIKWKPNFSGFLIYGLAIFAFDYFIRETSLSIRYLQKSALFILPFLWGSLGALLSQTLSQKQRLALYAILCFAGHFFYLVGQYNLNLSLGPFLIALPLINRIKYGKIRFKDLAIAAFCFLPLWFDWLDGSVQRTSLVLLLTWIIFLPLFFTKNILKSTLVSVPFLSLLTAGIVFFSAFNFYLADSSKLGVKYGMDFKILLRRSDGIDKLKSIFNLVFILPLRHGDDLPTMQEFKHLERSYKSTDIFDNHRIVGNSFQFRSRKGMWQESIKNWLEAPLFGLGFGPELPKLVLGAENREGTIGNNEPPLIGPHNSYLTILSRMGIVGLLVFISELFTYLKTIWAKLNSSIILEKNGFLEIVPYLIIVNGLIFAFLNIGFETPSNSITLWLLIGLESSRLKAMPSNDRHNLYL